MHYIMIIVPLAGIAVVAAIFFFLRGRRKSSGITVS
jgi:LPXTG-motif cell wall-anchored protein